MILTFENDSEHKLFHQVNSIVCTLDTKRTSDKMQQKTGTKVTNNDIYLINKLLIRLPDKKTVRLMTQLAHFYEIFCFMTIMVCLMHFGMPIIICRVHNMTFYDFFTGVSRIYFMFN